MARFCINCGAQITEGKKFCASCGTKIEGQQIAQPQPLPAPPPQQPYAPIPRKKSKAPLIAGIAGGVLVIALAVVLVVTLGKGGRTEITTSENENAGTDNNSGERLNVPDSVFDIPADYEMYDSSDEPIWDDPVDKIEYYELGDDKIPSVVTVVGDRFCPEKGSSLVNGATVYTARYTTDENDPAQVTDDVYAYIIYLMENEGFLNLIAFDSLPYEGGIELTLAKTSVDWGKIIILTIDYGYEGYTFEFWKGEGTLTEN